MKLQNQKGLSLLEMLVALGIFAFMFVFITQTVKQSYRQVKKVKSDIKIKDSFYHVIDLIKTDLSSVYFFLDISQNLSQHFPLIQDPQFSITRNSQKKNFPIFLDPLFVFTGSDNQMDFISYTLSENQHSRQWLKIRYYIEDCPSLNTNSSSPCLMRTESSYWNYENIGEAGQSTLVVLRDFSSMSFSYSQNHSLTNTEWESTWPKDGVKAIEINPENLSVGEASLRSQFPARVQITIKNQDSRAFYWFFSVSKLYLTEWNPYEKGLSSFKEWKPPIKTRQTPSYSNTNRGF